MYNDVSRSEMSNSKTESNPLNAFIMLDDNACIEVYARRIELLDC
jgi:hypothetical protein